MASPFERAIPRSDTRTDYTPEHQRRTHGLDDARLARREEAAARARRKARQ